ncbi:MAG: NlpC/P60 family protein [Actinomycetes bacterium]
MSRFIARRRLAAVGLIVAIASPLAPSTAGASDGDFHDLSLRDSGTRVLLAQRVLDVDPRTGVFNKKTRHQVRQFQERRGFAVTGVINQRTWNALEKRWASIQQARQQREAKYDRVMKVARNQKGDPYVYGAVGPNRFDCSGLTRFVYQQATGKSLVHSSSGQLRQVDRVSRKNARPGDLVFMYGSGGVYHVSIYAGKGQILHASRPGTNVKVDPIWTSKVYFGRAIPKP